MASIAGSLYADSIFGTPEADQISGGGSDDHLYGGAGDDQLDGGPGDDVLDDAQGVDRLDGGEGADLLLLYGTLRANPALSDSGVDLALGGPGHDMLVVRGLAIGHTLSGGGGSDFFSFTPGSNGVPPPVLATFTIVDFHADEGDRLFFDLQGRTYAWRGLAPAGFGANEGEVLGGAPGQAGIWTLAQGGDALVWVDLNANGTVDAADLRIRLSGQNPIGPEALAPGVLGMLQGTPGDDTLVGSVLDDMILGNGGNDRVEGGDGTDYIVTLDGNDVLWGGNGRDQLAAGNGSNNVDGGAGDDAIDIDGDALSVTTATGGPGQDTFALHARGATAVITDFEPGVQGDRLDVEQLVSADGQFVLPAFLDPFSPSVGHLRLVDAGGSTLLQWDRTGAGDGEQWATVATLQSTPAFALVPENLSGPWVIHALTVAPGNRAPRVNNPVPDLVVDEDTAVAFIPSYTTFEDDGLSAELNITATLADGSPLPAWLHFQGGVAVYDGVPGSGRFSGVPGNGDVGTLSLRLTATDAQGASAADDFLLTVRNVNDAPYVAQVPAAIQARSGSFLDWTLPAGTFADVDAGDRLLLSAVVDASLPLLLPAWLQFDPASGRLWGMPGAQDAGSLVVRFKALDTGGASAFVEVPLTVELVNRAPQATADAASTPAGVELVVPVLANDSDPDPGQTLSLLRVDSPRTGLATAQPDGTVRYAPLAGWNGVDSFGYTVGDGFGGSASATVTVTVLPTIAGTDAANNLGGGSGNDSIDARGGNDTVNAGNGDDFVRGGDGDDALNGGNGNDVLLGEAGNDTLMGQAGGDVLSGGLGADRIFTGTNNARADGSPDTVVFSTAPQVSGQTDTVYGFEANGLDRLALSPEVFAVLAGGATAGVDASEFRAGVGVQALDADDFLLFDTRTGQLYFDPDGNGGLARLPVANLAYLVGTLDATDFMLGLPAGV